MPRSFRRSCREGIAARVREHRRPLAGLHAVHADTAEPATIYPLNHLRVIRTSCPTCTSLCAVRLIEPWLQTTRPRPMESASIAKTPRSSRGGRQPRVHPLLLLHGRVPESLVDRHRLLGPPCFCKPGAGSPTAATRRSANASTISRPVSALSLPHDPQLHPHLPEGPELRQGDRLDQANDRSARVDRWLRRSTLSPHLQIYRPQLTSVLSITHLAPHRCWFVG